jgi:drug/metabolite transporter (DMT)-like permease
LTNLPAREGLSLQTLTLLGVAVCALIWGTTWYAITLQLGVVDAIASVTYRFGLAAAVILIGCLVTGRKLALTRAQHFAAMGQGLFVFAIDYAFVYWAEERVASAVVAVVFAALAFLNLILFRVVARQKASRLAWAGAFMGVLGVAALFGSELLKADMNPRAALGLLFALLAVLGAGIGNLFAWRGQTLGGAVIPMTGWSMLYGTGFLILYGLATGVVWGFELTPAYIGSLLYLSLLGSVTAFLLFFWIARTRGYAAASYISALTPPIAMLVSVVMEGAVFGMAAFAGLALVLIGQIMLARAPKVSAA